MLTTIDKALVGLIMALILLAQHAGFAVPEFMTETWAEGVVTLLSPALVWLVPNKTPDPVGKGARLPLHWITVLIACLLVAITAGGCAGTRAAYQAADGLNETAKVVSEHYYATVRELNALDDAGRLTDAQRAHLQDLVGKTSRPVLDLGQAGRAYEALATAETEAELEAAIAQASIALSRLIDAIDAATGGSSRLEEIRERLDELGHREPERATV